MWRDEVLEGKSEGSLHTKRRRKLKQQQQPSNTQYTSHLEMRLHEGLSVHLLVRDNAQMSVVCA
jgi:hypothetical protein